MDGWVGVVMGLATLAVVVPLMAWAPSLSRPTVPLGVSVPSAYVGHPVVVAAKRRYRDVVLVSGVVAAGLVVGLWRLPEVAALVPLAFLAFGAVVFARCRRPIVRAKTDEGWYDGVPVRVFASVTPEEPDARVVWPLHALAMVLALLLVVVTVLRYDRLPDPMPAHSDLAGHVDRWEAKSWPAALALPLLTLVMALALAVTCWFVARRPQPGLPDGNPALARARARRKARAMQHSLGWASVGTVVLLGGLDAAQVLGWPGWAGWAAQGLGLMLLLVLPLALAWWSSQPMSELAAASTAAASAEVVAPESPDDDRFWKWGMFYVNRDDPRALVPKRLGMGLDVNWGNPVAAGAMVALLLVPVVVTVIGLVAG